MKSESHIRALDRGLAVIEALSRHGHRSLAELRRETGLTNPTLLRVLGTLQARGWVRRNIVEGRFELSHGFGELLRRSAVAHPMSEFGAPILLELIERQGGLPSDLSAVTRLGQVKIIESTRKRGPMAPTRTGLDLSPSMIFSAHGRAVLAFSDPALAAHHIDRIRQFGDRDEQMWIETGRLEEEIALTRDRGFGMREKLYWAPPFDPGPELSAMAVPIVSDSGVHGTLSLVWVTAEKSLEEIIAQGGLEDLRWATSEIAAALQAAGIEAPLGGV